MTWPRLALRHTILGVLSVAVFASCDDTNDIQPTPTAPPATTATISPTAAPSPSPTVAPRSVTMRLQAPTPPSPVAGQMLTVPILIVGAANLGAYEFSPVYDSAILELISTLNGGFLGSTGRSPTCSTEARPPARVTFYCVTLGPNPAGPSGDGTLASLQFRALTPGTTTVTLADATAAMPDSTDLPVTVEPVSVTVAP